MSSSLRDQLLQLGFKTPEPPRRERKPEHKPRPGKAARDGRGAAAPPARAAVDSTEIDLAKAYALRQREERAERERIERERQAEAARRREARQKLHALLQGASLNDPKAELPRHFEHAGKIRRIYVGPEQLRALNAGELAVISAGGRYHLVALATAAQAEALMPDCIALKVDPDAGEGGDDYADPRYRVPDDLVW